MADFCTKCHEEMFQTTKNELIGSPDIDVEALFKELKEGNYTMVLCEGCGLWLILKLKGELRVWGEFSEDDSFVYPTVKERKNMPTYDEFWESHKYLKAPRKKVSLYNRFVKWVKSINNKLESLQPMWVWTIYIAYVLVIIFTVIYKVWIWNP